MDWPFTHLNCARSFNLVKNPETKQNHGMRTHITSDLHISATAESYVTDEIHGRF